jgi:hypothetical protein
MKPEPRPSSEQGLVSEWRLSGGAFDHEFTQTPLAKHASFSSRKVVNPLSTALRLAARTLRNSHSALGANFRRLIAKIGMPKAIAMARKLAVLIYRMLKYGTQYVDKGMQHYEAKYQARAPDSGSYRQKRATRLSGCRRSHRTYGVLMG